MSDDAVDEPDFETGAEEEESPLWRCGSHNLPAKEIVYFTQIGLVYIVVLTSIINLSLGNQPSDLWITLLSSCLGYILPQPQLRSSPFSD